MHRVLRSPRAILPIPLAALLFLAPGTIRAQSVDVGGQVRPRFETREPVDGSWDSFTSMRVRAQVAARLEKGVRLFAQLQDVRLFGEETSTLGDFRADNLDLHQGYLELTRLPVLDGFLRIGRQEVRLGEERLVGAVNWTQQGRSFDGVRLAVSVDDVEVDLLGMKLAENTAATREHDANLLGANARFHLGAEGDVELYGLFDESSEPEGNEQFTFGGRWVGDLDLLSVRLEGSVQHGTRGGEDVSAYMFGARAGTDLADGRAGVTLWYDFLSGDENPGEGDVKVFSTLFATNHAFYGYADLFTNIPVHSGGHGLQDFAVKLRLNPEGPLALRLDLHTFRAAQQGALSTTRLAEEADLTAVYRYSGDVTVTGGFSYVAAGDGIREIGRLEEDSRFAYLMMDVSF